LTQNDAESPVSIFLLTFTKAIKNTCPHKKSLHQDMVCLFKWVWVFEKRWNISSTKTWFMMSPSDLLATPVLNAFQRDKTNYTSPINVKQSSFFRSHKMNSTIFSRFLRAIRRHVEWPGESHESVGRKKESERSYRCLCFNECRGG